MPERRRRALRHEPAQEEVILLQAEAAPSPYSREAHTAIDDEPAAPAHVPAYGEEAPAADAAPADEAPVPDAPALADAPVPPARDVVATNTGVRLACTMAAMMGLFALFLCWAEQESRVIRRFSVQSVCLTALHAAAALAALLISGVLGGVPYVGMMVTLFCLLGYIAALMLLIVLRVRLMQHAWQGVRFMLHPALERIIARFY